MDLLVCKEIVVPELNLPRQDLAPVLDNLFRRQVNCRPAADYLVRTQTHGMTRSWRKRVCEWMFSVAKTVEFETTTVNLAINYLDRYLSVVSVQQPELELLALVCIMCASKFNEKENLSVGEVSQMIDEKYSTQVIMNLEKRLMRVLDWKLHAVLPEQFLECWIGLIEDPSVATRVTDACASMLAPLVQEMSTLDFLPSEIAYTVLSLAMHQLHVVAQLPTYSGESSRLNECEELVESIARPSTPSKPVKRAASPSNVEDFFEEESMPARQRRRID